MDNLIKITCSKSSSTKDKTDAYITVVQILSKDKNALENSIATNYGPNLLNSMKTHIDSRTERTKEVSLAALKALGCYLSMSSDLLQKLHGEDILSDIIECLCRLLQSDKGKQFYITGFWCFANQHIPNSILAKHVKKIVSCFQYHSSNNPSGTIMVEGLNAIKKLCENCPKEMEIEVDNCLDSIFRELGSAHLFRIAVDVMISCTPILLKKNYIRNYIRAHLNHKLCMKINKHYQDNASRVQLIKLWTCFSSLMGEEFFQLDHQVRSSMFKVMTELFKIISSETQFSLFNLWMTLINCIVNIPDEIDKREKIILQPMQLYHYYENPDIAEKCLKTYWYLICQIDTKINENVKKIVLPILEMFLKDNIRSAEIKNSSTSYTTPIKSVKSNVIETPKTPKISSSASPSLKLLSVEMLCVLLSQPDKRKEIKGSSLPPFCGPKLNMLNLYKYSDRFVKLILEATRCVPTNDMIIKIWVSFLTDALEFFTSCSSSVEAKQLWSNIFLVLKCIIDEKSGNIDFVLKIFPLIPVTQVFKELMNERNKMGLPAFFILQSLLDPQFVEKDIFENEKFFILYERMLEVLFNCITGQLSIALDIFHCIDRVRPLINDAICWRLWSTLCHVLINFVNLTNEVNQGTATDFKFDTVLKCLLYPLECIDWTKLKDGEKNTLKETWSELYETFRRATSLLPGLQDNLVIKTVCHTIAEHCNKVDHKTFNLLISMLRVIVKSEDLKILHTNSLLTRGLKTSKGTIKSEVPIENITHFLFGLKNLLTKIVNKNQEQVSRGYDMCLYEIVELVGFFFQRLNRYAELYEAMSTLNVALQQLFEKSNAKLMNHLVKLLDSILTAFEGASDVCYEAELLTLLEPLIIKSLIYKQKASNTRVMKFWNQTFGKSKSLICSDILEKSLISCKTPVKAFINVKSSVQVFDEVAQFPNDDNNLKMSVPLSPKKLGSFLPDNKTNAKSPIKLTSQVSSPLSTKRYTRRKSKVKDEFVEIKDTPKRSKLLTEHQKEVMREKKTIPLMYNSLDHSQDTSLFHLLTQDLSNSQASNGIIPPSKEEVSESCDKKSNNIDLTKCNIVAPILAEELNDKEWKDKKPENHDENSKKSMGSDAKIADEIESSKIVVTNPIIEDYEENAFIPSSQTQESFSQLRSSYVDDNNKKIRVIAESPEENLLKSVSSFTNLLEKDDYEDNYCVADEVPKTSVSESNKENTLTSWLCSKSKILAVSPVKVKVNINDNIAIKFDVDNKSGLRRKRKQMNDEICNRKKRSKSLGTTIEDNTIISSNIKVELDLCGFDNIKKASCPLSKRGRRRKTASARISQIGDIHNFLDASKKIKTEVNVEDVFLTTIDQMPTNKTEDVISILSLSPDKNVIAINKETIQIENIPTEECTTNQINNIRTVSNLTDPKDVQIVNSVSKSSISSDSDTKNKMVASSRSEEDTAPESESCTHVSVASNCIRLITTDKINSLPEENIAIRNTSALGTLSKIDVEHDDLLEDLSIGKTEVTKSICGNIDGVNKFHTNTSDIKQSESVISSKADLYVGNKSSELSPISKEPSAFASPSGILKKKFTNQSPSPPFKNRRVSFQLPEGFRSQKTDEEKEKFALLLNKGRKSKSKTFPGCIYPDLKDCSVPIEKILPSLTFSRGVGHLVRAQNILTIGDLSSLSEAQVESLPIRSPKIRTVKNVLNTFSTQQSRGKGTPCKSPLMLDRKTSGSISPKKDNTVNSNDTSLNTTPSKHGEQFRPTTLFSTTPKEEGKYIPQKKNEVEEDNELKSLGKDVSDDVNFVNDYDEKKSVADYNVQDSEVFSSDVSNRIDEIQSTPESSVDNNEQITCNISLKDPVIRTNNLLKDVVEISLNVTPVKDFQEKHSSEKSIDVIQMIEISPIKTSKTQGNDAKEVDIEDLKRSIHYSKESDSVSADDYICKIQNEDDFDTIDHIDHMEGITPMNVSNTSMENAYDQNSLIVSEEISNVIEWQNKQSEISHMHKNTELTTDDVVEKELQSLSLNENVNQEKRPIELLHSIDISKLSTADIFDLVGEIQKFKSNVMSELRTRMLTHNEQTK